MQSSGYTINLVFVIVVNTVFFLTGLALNSLVIVTFWRSTQLRKKLCYFMIMVLSCCDLLSLVTGHLLSVAMALLGQAGKLSKHVDWMDPGIRVQSIFSAASLNALLVMTIDRYLATSYPIRHRTKMTRGKLLLVFVAFNSLVLVLVALTVDDYVITFQAFILICFGLYIPPMFAFNYKLHSISGTKCRRGNIRSIRSCTLLFGTMVLLSIPGILFSSFKVNSKQTVLVFDFTFVMALWTLTVASMNSTFNSLIFYWKNKILRVEGMRIIRGLVPGSRSK